tara:strand:- start:524 stop:721 length:198 start_codon:yes stop_codon:yes gene_type:complete
MKKEIYSNIKDSDSLESFLNVLVLVLSIVRGRFGKACYLRHLEPININYPLKIINKNLVTTFKLH